MDADPGPGVENITAAGNRDLFVVKLNSDGNFQWAKRFGSEGHIEAYSVTLDINGNIYITGPYRGICDFDPGPGITEFTSLNFQNAYVMKLDPAGDFIWAKEFSGEYYVLPSAITVDSDGNIYTIGNFRGMTDFNPGTGNYTLTPRGDFDVYVSKLNTEGEFVWAKQIGGTKSDGAASIALDNSGNILLTGSFNGTVDFDPGSGSFPITSTGMSDGFFMKLNAAGDFMWAKKIGGTGDDHFAKAVISASTGNIYLSGGFSGTADFDSGNSQLVALGLRDAFIAKFDADGNFIWAIPVGESGINNIASILLNSNEEIFVSGMYTLAATFGSSGLSLTGTYDVYIAKLNASGNIMTLKSMGSSGYDNISAMDIDNEGSLILIGSFQDTVDFDPGSGVHNMVAAPGSDVGFVWKLSDLYASLPEESLTTFSMYPNPVSDKLTLSFNSPSNKLVTVFDIQGKLISQASVSDNIAKLDVQGLSCGMYLVATTRGGQTTVQNLRRNSQS